MNRTVLKALSLGTLLAAATNLVSCSTDVEDGELVRGEADEDEADALRAADAHAGSGSGPGLRIGGTGGPMALHPAAESQAPVPAPYCIEDPTPASCCRPDLTPLDGTAGSDVIMESSFDTTSFCVDVQGGNDAVYVGKGDDVVLLGDGNDTIFARDGINMALAGPGDDDVFGGDDDDALHGGEGDDFLDGDSGLDRLWGGEGNDDLFGSYDPDSLFGGAGDDQLFGGFQDDYIEGNAGNDDLFGSSGDDLLVPGPGADDVFGDGGNDVIRLRAQCELDAPKVVMGGSGFDVVESPFSQAELEAAGVQFFSIEDFVEIPADPVGACSFTDFGARCDCCDGEGLDPATGCSECGDGFISATPFVEGDDVPPPTEPPTCVPAPTCATLDCGGHGNCEELEEGAACLCDPGYVGVTCERCAIGFEDVGGGTCQPSQECAANFCHGRGSCVLDADRRLACDCDPGAAGPNCGPPPVALEKSKPSVSSGSQVTLSVPQGTDCPGGSFEWVTSGGTLQVAGDGRSAVLTAPILLPDDPIAMVEVSATCSTDADTSPGITVGVTRRWAAWGHEITSLEPFDDAILDYLDFFDIETGATLAVVKDDELIYLRSYGVRKAGTSKIMTPCTPMRIASGTKVFTRALFRELEADGATIATYGGTHTVDEDLHLHYLDSFRSLVGWDVWGDEPTDPDCPAMEGIGVPPKCIKLDYIVPFGAYDTNGWGEGIGGGLSEYSLAGLADPGLEYIRLSHLISHTSGLLSNRPNQHPNLIDPASGSKELANAVSLSEGDWPDHTDAIRYGAGASLQGAPGMPYHAPEIGGEPIATYSNVGYLLLARIIEWSSGKEYFEALRDEVMGPTGALGLPLGSDPENGDLMLYTGESAQWAVSPYEPVYHSKLGSRPDANTLWFDDGDDTWKTTGYAPRPYTLDFSTWVGSGDLVANARLLAELLRKRRVSSGREITATLGSGGGGMQVGTFDGTRSLLWQLPHGDLSYESPCPSDGIWVGTLPSGVAVAVEVAELPQAYDDSQGTCGDGEAMRDWDWIWLRRRLAIATAEVEASAGWPTTPGGLTATELQTDCKLCGNGVIDDEFGELCDGDDLGGETCESQGFTGGELACFGACYFDTSLCTRCGNGMKEWNEECDLGDFGGASCGDFGFDDGPLTCTEDCEIATSSCYECGDGIREGDEECDDPDFGGENCYTQGFPYGWLTCVNCYIDTSNCYGTSVDPPPSYGTADCGTYTADFSGCTHPEDCYQHNEAGNCLGGACALTDNDADEMDPASIYHPRGDFMDQEGKLYQCNGVLNDQGDPVEAVCKDVNGWGVCMACDPSQDPTGGENSARIGCTCETTDDCGVNTDLACYGQQFPNNIAYCWPEGDVPLFQCEYGSCGQSVRDTKSPDYAEETYCDHYGAIAHGRPARCQSGNCGGGPDCSSQPNTICDDDLSCIFECELPEHCQLGGWPANTVCGPDLVCVPPAGP